MAFDHAATRQAEPVLMISGDNVVLGPFHIDLAPLYQRWMIDFRLLRTLRGTEPLPMTADGAARIVESIANRTDEASYIIYERDRMIPIGTTVIAKIDDRNRTGLYGIVIGEPDARGKGLGIETTRLMLDDAFTALGL